MWAEVYDLTVLLIVAVKVGMPRCTTKSIVDRGPRPVRFRGLFDDDPRHAARIGRAQRIIQTCSVRFGGSRHGDGDMRRLHALRFEAQDGRGRTAGQRLRELRRID